MAKPTDAERRLVAIFAADVEGYSRLMGADEVGTLRDLTQRRAILDNLIASYRGRIANTAGDSVLAEFGSAVDAVQCAVAAQAALSAANADLLPGRHINFRIGVHVGDVMVKGGDLFGDGVNIAARLQALASAGGVFISGAAYDQVRKILPFAFTDAGAQQVKNIEEVVRTYAVSERSEAKSAAQTSIPLPLPGNNKPLPLPDKPSIAVLPFNNMSRDPGEEYFSDGITEDIITELSRFSELFVIARNSSFQYKGKSVDVRQIGRELGVRYLLEGSIRRGGDRVRITAQLIDVTTGTHRWAERYDRELKDVFAIQDELARTIAAILAAHVNKAEAERTLLKPPATWQAYDHYMRAAAALASFYASWKVDYLSETRRNLAESLSIDPKYARAYSMLASTYRVAWLNLLNDEYLSMPALDRAIQLARTAIEFDPNLPEAYAELGYTIIRKREFDAAAAAAERAIALNPNFADYRLALVFFSVGEPDKAIELAKRQMRLDPFHPHFAPLMLGEAHYLLKQYREAQHWLREATGRAPNHQYGHVWLAATYAQLGQLEDAQAEAATVLQINPRYTINSTQRRTSVLKRTEDTEHLFDGLRKAGLPE